METIAVELGSRSYEIHIQERLIDSAGRLMRSLPLSDSAAVITNTTVAPLYARRLTDALQRAGIATSLIVVPDGEQYKTLEQIEHIYTELLAAGLDRTSFAVALGGGVVGDMTGFAAATFMRGIPYIQVPTTLLAQVDSSVGGKTGVNLRQGKNLAGAFHQPRMVIIDPCTLATLAPREMRSGLAEIIKTAAIQDDALFTYLESHIEEAAAGDMPALTHSIASCCRIKAAITSRDETERGVRAHLNFGHTIGHAIEALTEFTAYTHGEAVAMGMAAIARLSCKLGYCDDIAAQRIERLITRAGLPVTMPVFSTGEYVRTILHDKKKSTRTMKMVFLQSVGCVFLKEIQVAELDSLINKIRFS